MPSEQHIVEDLLQPGLRVVFCGTALGRTSATAKTYYAHPRNVFWQTLHDIGLTTASHPLTPADYIRVLDFGLGLTDLCKFKFGNDSDLPRSAFDVLALRNKIEYCAPTFLAFTSKKAGQIFCGPRAMLGWQVDAICKTRIYILPSTSPSARWQWNEHKHHWKALADAVKQLRMEA